MAKDRIDMLLEENTIQALEYIQEMGYEPDTTGYAEVMKEVRENYKLITRQEAIKTQKRKDRAKDWGLGIAQILIPAAIYFVMGKTCLVYEETGAITSAIGRSIVSHIRPDRL